VSTKKKSKSPLGCSKLFWINQETGKTLQVFLSEGYYFSGRWPENNNFSNNFFFLKKMKKTAVKLFLTISPLFISDYLLEKVDPIQFLTGDGKNIDLVLSKKNLGRARRAREKIKKSWKANVRSAFFHQQNCFRPLFIVKIASKWKQMSAYPLKGSSCCKNSIFVDFYWNISICVKKTSAKNTYLSKTQLFWWKNILSSGWKSTFLFEKNFKISLLFWHKFFRKIQKKNLTNRHILKYFSEYSPYPTKNINFFLKKSDFWEKVDFQLWEFLSNFDHKSEGKKYIYQSFFSAE